jgi:hypothetical protein
MEQYFSYLDKLRESGIIDMLAASPYLEATFGLDHTEATRVLLAWVRTYNPELPVAERARWVPKALSENGETT